MIVLTHFVDQRAIAIKRATFDSAINSAELKRGKCRLLRSRTAPLHRGYIDMEVVGTGAYCSGSLPVGSSEAGAGGSGPSVLVSLDTVDSGLFSETSSAASKPRGCGLSIKPLRGGLRLSDKRGAVTSNFRASVIQFKNSSKLTDPSPSVSTSSNSFSASDESSAKLC